MGSSIVETIVAAGVMASVVLGVAQLFAAATDTNRRAAVRTTMTICAIQKVEELRVIGAEAAEDVEHLDAAGNPVAGRHAVFVRRWSVRPLPADPDLLLIQVLVSGARAGDVPIVSIRRRR